MEKTAKFLRNEFGTPNRKTAQLQLLTWNHSAGDPVWQCTTPLASDCRGSPRCTSQGAQTTDLQKHSVTKTSGNKEIPKNDGQGEVFIVKNAEW